MCATCLGAVLLLLTAQNICHETDPDDCWVRGNHKNTEQQNIPVLLLCTVTPDLLLCAVILSFIATTATE